MTLDQLENALRFRTSMFDERHQTAFRLFNGFTEGAADITIDVYAKSLVIQSHAAAGTESVDLAQRFLVERLPWIQAVIVKDRTCQDKQRRRGTMVYGETWDRKILEDGVWYAVDLTLNQDASLYLDTRGVRTWARKHLKDRSVLNTFAYTGSLGVAAKAGDASRVVHLELNRKFLNVAKTSYTLNGFPIEKRDFQTADFWSRVNNYKRSAERFDCIFLDPPLYSATSKGVVDLAGNYARLINKVRPLTNHDGYLIAINNALFVSGAAYMKEIESLCADGYVSVEELINVPEDFIGDASIPMTPVTDPSPFNHSTKIVVLRIRRKGEGLQSRS
jgi:23S rRNA (cytosine1962-C5)-methyltransferase